MEIAKTTYMNRLFDFYGSLLTDKQQGYLNLYYGEDYSLGEIAEVYEVSRQAVFDNVKRSEQILKEYEDKLGLLEDDKARAKLIEKIQAHVKNHYANDTELLGLLEALEIID